MSEHWTDKLIELDACPEAVEWAIDYDTFEQAWQECERGDWMLWLAAQYVGGPRSKSRKQLVYAACQCASTAWEWMSEKDKEAIRITEAWTRGEAKLSEVKAARAAAGTAVWAAAGAAARAAAGAAAGAAAEAAGAAEAAAWTAAGAAAGTAVWAAEAAAGAAAGAAAWAAAETAALKKCADIVRKHLPTPKI